VPRKWPSARLLPGKHTLLCNPLWEGDGIGLQKHPLSASDVSVACASVSCREASNVEGVQQWPFRAVGDALEVIPRTLAQNCGANVVRALTTLRVGALGASYH
jgi:hypothetical protein